MRRIAFVLLAITLGSAYAFAIDGQVLINQSTVMAGGGFPYRITQPGSYKLSGNLAVPTGFDGIKITADNVVLDLNGFSISSSGNGCSISGLCTYRVDGISYSGLDTVRNGSVSGFRIGVLGSGHGIVEEIQATANLGGISASNSLVRRNNASGNLAVGIEGIDSNLLENITNDNQGEGLFSLNGTVLQNVANRNEVGFDISGGLFGSNTALSNIEPVSLAAGAISQNNNNCGGGSC